MSGLGGIYRLDGMPIIEHDIKKMLNAAKSRGVDGMSLWVSDDVGLGSLHHHINPESVLEKQPLYDTHSSCAIVFHGRLDNRKALLDRLGVIPNAEMAVLSDCEIVLEIYKKWSEQTPQLLLGDFAFAIWDGVRRRLFCARDILGLKPFHYSLQKGVFVFSSDIRQLLALPFIDASPNLGMVGEYISNQITSRSETLFEDIYRLEPAHYLIVENGKLVSQRYWNVDFGRQIYYGSDSEYVEHFLEIFERAVKSRLRATKDVGVFLSGGMDSSCVAAMVTKQRSRDMPLESFSLLFNGLPCDESKTIAAAAVSLGLASNTKQFKGFDPAFFSRWVQNWQDFPEYPNLMSYLELIKLAKRKGLDAILSGSGADDWLDVASAGYPDMIKKGAFSAVAHKLKAEIRQQGMSPGLKTLMSQVLATFTPSVHTMLKSLREEKDRVLPFWVGKEFASCIDLRSRLKRGDINQSIYSDQQQLYSWLNDGYQLHFIEAGERICASQGAEERFPFHDKRIIEFAFSIPPEQKWCRSGRKPIVRGAIPMIRPDVKPSVYSWVEGSPMYLGALESLGGKSFFDNLVIADLNWVKQSSVDWMYKQMWALYRNQDIRYCNLTRPLWMLAGVELWYRQVVMNEEYGVTYERHCGSCE